ncbi:MAG: TRAP transporter small permease subunit [Alphaproteobacteria bacterium]|jgi:TRAP-type C4-dicarboxylate transport system permease small subunit|nr:TRAP transporter small permease subunit [Alphaproteobacteria bacterium]MCK5623092.1 TRAP transporter small permease subunit [Alphaproteobacteria bacterium]
MKPVLAWLRKRADNVAVGLLTAMFLSFVLQIFTRYVINHPLGWTLEACLMTWLWVVFWGSAFVVNDRDHVKFDMLYTHVRPGIRRIFALIAAVAIAAGFASSFAGTIDYVTFMKIEKSSMLHIRLDYVFSVYGVFAAAIVLRYGWRVVQLIRGIDPDAGDILADRVAPDE